MAAEPRLAETAKQRSLRVPLDYLQRGAELSRTKWLVAVVVGGMAVVYVAWLLLGTRAGNAQASPGRVSAAHATWDDDCQVCHVSFRPLRSDAVDLISLVRGRQDAVHSRTLRDEACSKCHRVAVHHGSEKASDVATCAACHREHGGAAANLLRPADRQCTTCHGDIAEHRQGDSGLIPEVANVTAFAGLSRGGQTPHPEFRSLASDPGNIKFNHWLHLQPGIAVGDAKRKLRRSDIEPGRQAEYARFGQADGLVLLDCSACHQPSERGDLMRPIAYEEHCRACHPLRADVAAGARDLREVPHGLSAARLGQVLDGMLVESQGRAALASAEASADESGAAPLIPGKTLGRNLAQKLSADVLLRRATLRAAVSARCEQCHEWQAVAADEAAGDLPDVLPANVPSPWLAHARFDHAGHRQVECRTCHAAAYAYEQRDRPRVLAGEVPSGFVRARDNEEVMIAGRESCATCHAPRRGAAGGARHDCAECHAYHGRDRERMTGVDQPAVLRGGALGELRSRLEPGMQLPDVPGYFLTSLRASIRAAEGAPNAIVGSETCVSAGCHGDAGHGAAAWRTAFDTWLAKDPHLQAENVLWTSRGREITRLLGGLRAATEQGHQTVVQQRCVACHATRLTSQAGGHSLGVECESCHGAAEGWLHAHYRRGFDRNLATGFVDTKKLEARSAVCMPCHVGPNDSAGARQVVDHDLIAAGHPRLSFDFHTYLESLPAHWDRQLDHKRLGQASHYRMWLAGEAAMQASLESLINVRKSWPDFSLLDCAACHHALGKSDWRQRVGFSALTVPQALPESKAETPPGRVAWARELYESLSAGGQRMSHDDAVRRYLAIRAVIADFETAPPAVRRALDEVGRYLAADCFAGRLAATGAPAQYELPAAYEPAKLAEFVATLVTGLREMETSLSATRSQP